MFTNNSQSSIAQIRSYQFLSVLISNDQYLTFRLPGFQGAYRPRKTGIKRILYH